MEQEAARGGDEWSLERSLEKPLALGASRRVRYFFTRARDSALGTLECWGGRQEDVALSYVYAYSGCVAARWLCVL